MHDAGTCDNRRGYYLDHIERVVIGGLRDHLGTSEAIAYFVECYNAERRHKAAIGGSRRAAMEKELAEIDRRIDRAVAAIIDGRITEQEAARHLPALRQRRHALAAELAAIGSAGVIVLRPAAVDTYLRDLQSLELAINADLAIGVDPAASAIRAMIETVTVVPAPAGEAPEILVRGDLAGVLGLDEAQRGRCGAGVLVAEDGFEPPTRGLRFRRGRLK